MILWLCCFCSFAAYCEHPVFAGRPGEGKESAELYRSTGAPVDEPDAPVSPLSGGAA